MLKFQNLRLSINLNAAVLINLQCQLGLRIFGITKIWYMRGVNRGMQIRRSVPFFRQIRQSANIFVQIRKVNLNSTTSSTFAQIVKKVTCLFTITQYNSNNSLTRV